MVRSSAWKPKGVSVRLYAPLLAMPQANRSGACACRHAGSSARGQPALSDQHVDDSLSLVGCVISATLWAELQRGAAALSRLAGLALCCALRSKHADMATCLPAQQTCTTSSIQAKTMTARCGSIRL